MTSKVMTRAVAVAIVLTLGAGCGSTGPKAMPCSQTVYSPPTTGPNATTTLPRLNCK